MRIDIANHIRNRLPELSVVIRRFPLPVLAALALTLYVLFDIHRAASVTVEGYRASQRVVMGLALGFIWTLGCTLYGERRGATDAFKIGAGLVGSAVLAILILRHDTVLTDWSILGVAGTIGLSVAAYIERGRHNSEVWQFNHHFWIGWVVSVLAAVLFAGGLSIIIETLRYLFGLALPYQVHEKIWTVACCFVAPVYWLSMVPRDFRLTVVEGEQSEFTSRSIAALVRYILVPLLLVYAIILHAYAVKILFERELPKNRIGWLVLSFGMVMAVTALAAYPTRAAGGRVVALFWRIWPGLLVLPTMMLFVAIRARIAQYGVTEERYLVVLAGLWLAGLVVTQGLFSAQRDLRLITGSLAVLLALGSIGPLSMTSVSVRSQVQSLTTSLSTVGIVRDGRVVPDAKPADGALSDADRSRLHGVIDYLENQGRLWSLQPLFAGSPKDPFQASGAKGVGSNSLLAASIREQLGLRSRPARDGDARSFVNFNGQSPAVFPVPSGSRLIGPIALSNLAKKAEPQTISVGDETWTALVDGKSLELRRANGDSVQFDLSVLSTSDGLLMKGPPPRPSGKSVPFAITGKVAGQSATALMTIVNGQRQDDGSLRLTYLVFWLIMPTDAK